MKITDKFWTLCVRLFNIVTLSSIEHNANQQPLGGLTSHGDQLDAGLKGPIFSPPNGPDDFVCDYSGMKGSTWRFCSTPNDRGCWLTNGTKRYGISTDYEAEWPQGITRKYTLNVTDMTLAPDGYQNKGGKAFNRTYPGPWIRACWGDNVEVTVTNYLKNNGTTVHWHGIRQLGTPFMDGVNGVTQCPIAGSPNNDSYTYKFKASQYGTSWYHSHYALQYADGILGPLTIFGPSSANYDEAVDPLLMADWNHQSAFSLFYQEITPGKGPPSMTSILLNGIGQYKCTDAEKKSGLCVDQTSFYNMTLTKGKRYLLRLINTSVDSTFIFSIDNHNVTVIGADFVPIHPYETNSVLVGIGQRYHVIVNTNTINDHRPANQQAYWIRTVVADHCGGFSSKPDNRTGILFYDGADKKLLPKTNISSFPTACSDEPYEKLKPYVPWQVGVPANQQESSTFEAGLDSPPAPGPFPPPGPFSHWSLASQPLWINFSNPTIRNVNQAKTDWAPQMVVVPENVQPNAWVYLLVTATAFPFGTSPGKNFVPASHPVSESPELSPHN